MQELAFEEYVDIFRGMVPKSEKVDSATYRGRCPICGDSKKSKSKKRFYIIREEGKKPCMIYCHNCGLSKTAYNFFKEKCPSEIDKRKKPLTERDLEEIKKISSEKASPTLFYSVEEIEEITPENYFNLLQTEVDKAKSVVGKFFSQFTQPIFENAEALSYIRSRNVPEYHIEKLLLLRPEFHDQKVFRFAYFRDYIIFPFIDRKDNTPYYFHARRYRNLESSFARFLSCPYHPDDVEVDFFLNELYVDPAKTVIVSEGTIDSMNLENAISTNGVKKISKRQIPRFEYRYGGQDNIIYALDNEMIDQDARRKVEQLLRIGKRVFLWSLLAKDIPAVKGLKDFNDVCLKANKTVIPSDTIRKYSTTSIGALLEGS